MAKLTLNPITSGYRSSEAFNANFDAIETAFENTLSRDGTEPNFMDSELDMDSNRIINLGAPQEDNDAARLIDIETLLADITGVSAHNLVLDTIAQLEEANVSDDISTIFVMGYYVAGDSDPMPFRRVDEIGTDHEEYYETANGAFFELRTRFPELRMFGAKSNGQEVDNEFTGQDNVDNLRRALVYCDALGLELWALGRYKFGKLTFGPGGNDKGAYINTSNMMVAINGGTAGGTEFLIDEDPDYNSNENDNDIYFLGDDKQTELDPEDQYVQDLYPRLTLRNIHFKGRWSHAPGVSGVHVVQPANRELVEITNCTFSDMRQKVMRGESCKQLRFLNNNAFRCAKGVCRMTGVENALVEGNRVEDTSDTSFDLVPRAQQQAGPARGIIKVVNNTVKGGKGISLLGARRALVEGNHLFLTQSTPIVVGLQGPAGINTVFDIKVINNTISNPLIGFRHADDEDDPTAEDDHTALRVGGIKASLVSSTVVPGRYDSVAKAFLDPWDVGTSPSYDGGFYYAPRFEDMALGTLLGYSAPPAFGIVVANNIIERTLPLTSNYWGGVFGEAFNGETGYITDQFEGPQYTGAARPNIVLADFVGIGMKVARDIDSAQIYNNTIRGFRGGEAIYIDRSDGETGQIAHNNILVYKNTIQDCKVGIFASGALGGGGYEGFYDGTVVIDGNIIDLDPYHKSSLRVTSSGAPTGGWTVQSTDSNMRAICVRQSKGWTITNNHIKNCYEPLLSSSNFPGQAVIKDNYIYCFPVSTTHSESNLGVGVPGPGGEAFKHVIINGTPGSTSVTINSVVYNTPYGQILCMPYADAGAQPDVGTAMPSYWVRGAFVRKNNSSISGGKCLIGWARLTTGGANVAGTDWTPVYGTTS